MDLRSRRTRHESLSAILSARAKCAAAFLAAAAIFVSPRLAAGGAGSTYEWLGATSGATDGNMTGTSGNYMPTYNPAGNTTSNADTIEFNAPDYYDNSPVTNTSFDEGGLWFSNDDAFGMTIGAGGGTLTLVGNPTANSGDGILVSGGGAVTINAPVTLQSSQSWINNSTSALTVAGSVSLSSSTLTIGGSGLTIVSGDIANTAGSLTIGTNGSTTQAASVTLSGNNAYSGTTSIAGFGTLLNIDSANALGTSTLSFSNQKSLIDAPVANEVLTNTVTGGGFQFVGTHNLTLGALNISGNWSNVINNGVLTFNNGAAATSSLGNGGTTGNISSTYLGSGATAAFLNFTAPNVSLTTASLVINGGIVMSTTGDTFTYFSPDWGFNDTTVNGVISNGTGSVSNINMLFGIAVGSNNNGSTPWTTLFLTGANTYTGTTTIDGGILSTGPTGTLANSGGASSIGTSGTLIISGQGDKANSTGGADGAGGGTLQYANTSATPASTNVQIQFGVSSDTAGYTNSVDASGNNTITFSNTAAVTYGDTGSANLAYGIGLTGTGSGVFNPIIPNNGTGAVTLTKGGTGSWTLGSAETYNGLTTISAGTLTLASGVTLASTSLMMTGGTLVDGNGTSESFSQTLSLGSGITVTNGSTVNLANITSRFPGVTLAFGLTSGTINVGGTTVTNGILGGWAVVNGTNWAAVNGSNNVIALTTYTGGALPTSGGATTSNYSLAGPLTANVQAQTGIVSAYTLNITDATSGDTLALGSNNLTFTSNSVTPIKTGGLLYSGGSTFNITGTGYLSATTNNELILNVGSGTLNVSAPLVGSGSTGALTVTGPGTLVLNNGGSNYAGETYANSGTLQLGVSSTTTGSAGSLALSSGPTGKGLLSVNGSAILDLNGNNLAVLGLASYGFGSGGMIGNSSTTVDGTLTIITAATKTTTYYGTIADAVNGGTKQTSVVIAGSGTQTFGGQSTYSGGTTVYSGTLNLQQSALLNSSGAVIGGPIGTGTLTIGPNGAQVNIGVGQSNMQQTVVALPNNIVLNGTMMISDPHNTSPDTLSGVISGPGGITTSNSIGSTYLALSNPNNSFTGTLTINGGYPVQIDANGALPAGDDVAFGTATGSPNLYLAQPDGSLVIGALNSTSSVTNVIKPIGVTTGVFQITVGANNATGGTFYGSIQNNTEIIALTKIGTGTQILAGGNTYTGPTTVDGGTLKLNGSGSTVVISGSSSLVLGGGTLDDVGTSTAAQGFNGTTVFAGASAVTNGSTTHSDTLGALTRYVGGTVNFSATNTASTGNGSITTTTTTSLTNGILGGWATYQGTAWTASGTSGTNPISGYTAGTTAAGNMSSSTTNFIVSANDSEGTATANSVQFGSSLSGTTTLTATSLALTSGGILVPSNAAAATVITGGTITGPAGNTAPADVIVNQYNAANTMTIGSAIVNNTGTSTSLTVSGGGNVILTGPNTYTGGTFLNAGTLQIDAGGSTGTLGSGNVATGAGAVLSFGRGDTAYVVSNVITGAGSVQQTISGAGTVTLSGANTYASGTTITAGTLRVANTSGSATGSGTVTVGNVGGTLFGTLAGSTAAGQGTITGPVTVYSGSTLSASNAIAAATLTLSGGLTLGSGAISALTLNSTSPNGTSNPLVAVGGAMSVSGASVINVSFSTAVPTGNYDLFSYGSLSGTSYSNLSVAGPAGYIYTLSNNTAGSQIDLSVVSGLLAWSGQNGGAWDTSTQNWYNAASTSIAFANQDPVAFYDTAYGSNGGPAVQNAGSSMISGTGGVQPLSVDFYNTSGGAAYTITSSDSTNMGINGPTGIALHGTGTVTLVGQNTYTGATTLNAGVLNIANVNSIGYYNSSNVAQAATLNFNGGTLQFATGSTPANLDISAGTVNIESGGATIDLNGNSATFAGAIGGTSPNNTGSLTVVDSSGGTPGTLTLSASNTYSGATNLNGGTVRFSSLANLGTGSAINFGVGSVTGGTLQWTTGNMADISSRTVSIGSGGATLDINGNNVTLSSPIGNSGTGGLTLLSTAGPASLTLAAANTYGGATNVNAGTLRVTNISGSATGPTGTVTVAGGATLAGGGGSTPGTITGPVNILAGGTIAPSNGGTLSSSNTGMLTVGALTLTNGATSASQLNYLYNSTTMPPSLDEIAVSGVLALPTSTAASEIQFNFFAPGTTSALMLPVNPTNSPYILMSYGSLASSFNANVLSVNPADLNGTLAEFSTTNIMGTNVLELNIVTSNESGGWTSNATGSNPADYGTAANWSSETVPNGVGLYATFGSGSQMAVSVNSAFTVGQLNFNNSIATSSSNYMLTGSGSLTLNNSGGGGSINVTGNVNPMIAIPLTLADSSMTTTLNVAAGSSLDLGAAISESTPVGQQVVLTGGGIVTMEGNNTYTGGTTIADGTLQLNTNGTSGTLGTGPVTFNPPPGATAALNVNTGGNLSINNLSETVNSSQGTTQVYIASGSTLTVTQTASASLTATLNIGDAGGAAGLVLNQGSTNTLTISGAAALSIGSTITVNSGTLALTNNTGTQATVVSNNLTAAPLVSVASGATLQLAGTTSVLNNGMNVITHGTGASTDGILSVVGTTNQTVGIISGDTMSPDSVTTTYSGNTAVGDGTNAANLTATQILQNTLTINAGSTVTIAPSGAGIESGLSTASAVASDTAADMSGSEPSEEPLAAIQAAIASGEISVVKGEQLENRIAAIEKLAATDPGLNVSLLEDRVLSALPSPSVWSSTGGAPLVDSGSGLLAADSGTTGSTTGSAFGGSTAAFAPAAGFGGSPAAVPEPSTLLLAALTGIGLVVAMRRRSVCCE